MDDSSQSDATSPSGFGRIDAACSEFEAAQRAGQAPRIEEYIERVSPRQRKNLLQELMTVECSNRLDQGKRPSFRVYLRRFPGDEAVVRQVFEDLELMDLTTAEDNEDKTFSGIPEDGATMIQSSSKTGSRLGVPTSKTNHSGPALSGATRAGNQDSATAAGGASRGDSSSDSSNTGFTCGLEEFIDTTVYCGIGSREEIQALVDSLSAEQLAATALAQLLRDQGQLTEFQATQILQGHGRSLIMGSYLLLDQVGQGGMGMVFRAKHRKMRRVVALKVLPPYDASEQMVSRFEREIHAVSELQHPNIITAHDAGESDGVHFLAMELISGVDLSRLVEKQGPLPPLMAVNYILQAALGLEHAHQAKILHRDVKPANMLLSQDGVVKVLDLGLARPQNDDVQSLTGTGDIIGTASYMAPEQAMQIKDVNESSDVYSLGCTLYYLLTGAVPYRGDTSLATLYAHQEDPIPSLLNRELDVPEWL
ncbi:MAG: serine/threonine protein kinase, partial [Planctomycetales bacterium]